MLPHRYQPEQPNTVYQMARTSDELDPVDQNELVSSSDSQTGFLPEAERLSLKTILSPQNTEPSKFSGLIVNISTSLLGKSLPFPLWCLGSQGNHDVSFSALIGIGACRDGAQPSRGFGKN